MSAPVSLVTRADKEQQAVAAALQELVDEINGGHVTGFTVVIDYDDSTYRIKGSSTRSRTQTAGALFDAAIERLGYVCKSD